MDTLDQILKNKISPHAFVSPNAIIGKGNIISDGAIIRDNVIIGNNNYIGPYCIIGEIPESENFIKKHTGKVIIGNNNTIFKQVTIDGGTEKVTIIGNSCLLLKNSHVGHDAELRNKVRLSCNASIGGHTIVGERTVFGIGAVAHQRLKIPKDIFIGLNSVITKKSIIKAGFVYAGIPVKEIRCNHIFETTIECSIEIKKCIRCKCVV